MIVASKVESLGRWLPIALAGIGVALGSAASAQERPRRFDIPAQPLSSALLDFSRQSDVLIVLSPEAAGTKRSAGLRGTLPVEVAIATLLRGSGLRAYPNPRGGYVIGRADRGRRDDAPPRHRPAVAAAPATSDMSVTQDVVVTAQKRPERLADVPAPVSVLDPEVLERRHQDRLQDLFASVPGLSISAQGNGANVIVLRGISTGNYGNPTVAVLIDDVPFGSSTALGGGQLLQPELDPADLQRIEVLRGPQGTLYGASSLGGLVKYVTADPSTLRIDGRVEVGMEATDKGGVGYTTRASVDLPLGATVAVRASGYVRRTPGYIDNLYSGRTDVNALDVRGGRLALLWRATEALSVKLGILHQDNEGRGSSLVNTDVDQRPLYGDLDQSYLPGSGAFALRSTLLTANVDLAFGRGSLKSITGYGLSSYVEDSDKSPLFVSAPYGLASSKLANDMRTRKVTQEVRLAIPTGDALDWLVGVFFTQEASPVVQQVDGADPVTGKTLSTALTSTFRSTFREAAAFGDVTFHPTTRFSLQAGVRYSGNRQRYAEVDTGPAGLTGAGVPFATTARSADHAATVLLVPQFRINRHAMAYGRIATGYRPGGPNPAAPLFGLPSTFAADRTTNYELGAKGDLWRDRLTYDLSVYRIDWRAIQVRLLDPTRVFSYFTNGGQARSQGAEATLDYRFHDLHLTADASYDDAELSNTPGSDFQGVRGDRLPFTPRFAGSVSADREIALSGRWRGVLGATLSYVGGRPAGFPARAGNLRVLLPAFTTGDVRVGVMSDTWIASLSVRNVADARGTLYSSSQASRALATSVYSTTFIQPRTIGLSLTRRL